VDSPYQARVHPNPFSSNSRTSPALSVAYDAVLRAGLPRSQPPGPSPRFSIRVGDRLMLSELGRPSDSNHN
jgi:hypothetical protein